MNSNIMRAAGIAVSVSLLAMPVVATSQTVGVNSAVRNIVKVKSTKAAEERQAKVKQKVSLRNEIRTASASMLQVLLLDKSSLTVGPNARFTVDKFIFDPKSRSSSVGANFAKGTFRFLSGKSTRNKPGQTSLTTPISSIGIRGTMVEGAVGEDAIAIMTQQTGFRPPMKMDAETATLIVLRGPGKRAQMGEKPGIIDVTANGTTVTLDTAGSAVFIPGPAANPSDPFSLTMAAYAMFDAALRTIPQPTGATARGKKSKSQETSASDGTSRTTLVALLGALSIGGLIAVSSGNGASDSDSDRPTSP
ncbi:FecR family protein [Parasphingorhabdus sp.]|uniref:FecR family protein n=1 Tax=Parasphingorhabdus sp. TaxID=2709688 RepID=UPI0030025223